MNKRLDTDKPDDTILEEPDEKIVIENVHGSSYTVTIEGSRESLDQPKEEKE